MGLGVSACSNLFINLVVHGLYPENKLLVKNETENETVVSIFCTNTQNCTGINSDFNNEICKKNYCHKVHTLHSYLFSVFHDDGHEGSKLAT